MLRWKSSLKPAAAAPATDITLEDSAVTTGTDYSAPVDINVNIPAVSANDILLLLCSSDSISNPTNSPPAGWTKIADQDGTTASQSTVVAYWKRASSSASATTELWSSFYSDTGESYYILVGAYSGCVTSGSPVDAYGSSAAGFASTWSVNVTTTTADTMIVTISGNTKPEITHTWSDGTELIDTAYAGVASVSINEKLEATTGSKTRTVTPSITSGNSMLAVALKPAVSGGGGWEQLLDQDGTTARVCGNSKNWFGWQFEAQETGTVTSLTLHCKYNGTPTSETFDIEFWSDDGANSPDSVLSNGSVQYSLSSFPSTASDFQVDYPTGPELTASTLYWIVVHSDQLDSFEHLTVYYDASEGTYDHDSSSDGISWSSLDFSATLRATINGTS